MLIEKEATKGETEKTLFTYQGCGDTLSDVMYVGIHSL